MEWIVDQYTLSLTILRSPSASRIKFMKNGRGSGGLISPHYYATTTGGTWILTKLKSHRVSKMLKICQHQVYILHSTPKHTRLEFIWFHILSCKYGTQIILNVNDLVGAIPTPTRRNCNKRQKTKTVWTQMICFTKVQNKFLHPHLARLQKALSTNQRKITPSIPSSREIP